MTRTPLLSLVFAWAALPAAAAAQYFDETATGERAEISSPEVVTLELRGGPFRPAVGFPLDQSFADDDGPSIGVELHGTLFRLKDVGALGVGAAFGWASYDGPAFTLMDGQPVATAEESNLTLLQFPVFGVVRIDALSRLLEIPLVVTGKVGLDMTYWTSSTGESSADGLSLGLRWAAQVALELDFFDRQAARSLDEEWGINHTMVFFEFYGSTAGGETVEAADCAPDGTACDVAEQSLPTRPENGWAWALGLALIF